ncbi:hypothetical protein [Frankia sp. Cas4]|uniref:hypothetical protein n=1 Tax=Frankia sp. Cas4 TaxID=3073927 RepID=UPI002AD3FD52|nr:hypothetical protein [Frankia sp. Cas4]
MSSPTRLACLGPPDTFSDAALLTLLIVHEVDLDPLPNVAAVLGAVRQVDAALAGAFGAAPYLR